MANMDQDANRDTFGSKFGIIAAAAGSAVGLGNIWKFPYITGIYGGAAFILIYLGFIVLIGLPVMISEFVIGRKGQRNAFGSFKNIAPGSRWYYIGILGVLGAFFILSFYSTVAGWTIAYLYKSITNSFAGQTSEGLQTLFNNFVSDPIPPLLWQFVFLVVTSWIVIAGVKRGIERYAKLLMPFLILIIIILDIRALTLPGSEKGLEFLFKPDFSKITSEAVLSALGHAFFTLSLGMGTLITYASYFRKGDNMTNTAITVAGADTLIALMAGIAIFPAVFAFNIEPGSGPGLVFITLPNIFIQMQGGYIFSLLFFTLLALAAITSAISILEVVVAYLSEEKNISRKKATIIATTGSGLLGILCTLSFSSLSGVEIFGNTVFDLVDKLSANIILPLGGLLIVLFIGWYMGRGKTWKEISNRGELKLGHFPTYMFLVKYIAPFAIGIVFLHGLGLFDFFLSK